MMARRTRNVLAFFLAGPLAWLVPAYRPWAPEQTRTEPGGGDLPPGPSNPKG